MNDPVRGKPDAGTGIHHWIRRWTPSGSTGIHLGAARSFWFIKGIGKRRPGWTPGGFPKIRPCRWRNAALRPPAYEYRQEGPV